DGAPAVTVHPLVHAVARARSEARDIAQGAIVRLIVRLVTVCPRNAQSNPTSWPLCAQLTPHFLMIFETVPVDEFPNGEGASLIDLVGMYYYDRAAYAEARPLFERALEIREKTHGAEHPERRRVSTTSPTCFEPK